MTPKEVLDEITRRAWRFGVAVVMSPNAYVMADGLKVGGYFDPDSSQPILAVATGGPEDHWLGLLLHEYSHVTQWMEQPPVWRESNKGGRIDDWLAGKSVKNIKAVIAATRDMEADCERRTIRLAMELDAPIDLERYVRGANSYIHFHNTLAETRKWYRDGQGPYHNEAVLAAANPTFDLDFSRTPKALADELRKCV